MQYCPQIYLTMYMMKYAWMEEVLEIYTKSHLVQTVIEHILLIQIHMC
jgi:hypothetical protein